MSRIPVAVAAANRSSVDLETRLAAVDALLAASTNLNEWGWLNAARRALRSQLGL